MNSNSLKDDIRFEGRLGNYSLEFYSTWGLFSPRSIDEGTSLLAGQLKVEPDATALDLGCGYGPLGLVLAKMAPGGHVHLVDKDFVAIEYAQKNLLANDVGNATAYLSNGFSLVPQDLRFDVIVSNVPAKIGNELLRIFLLDAFDRLTPGGQLYLVTISGLKDYMKRNLNQVFGNYEKLKQSHTYTACRAIKT
jgi:16S rRNA (guanine1207-N2)-methyltransferase